MGCRKYSYFLVLWIIAYSSPTLGQTPADSLIRELALTHNEELQMEILEKIVSKFFHTKDHSDTNIYYAQKLRLLSKKTKTKNYYENATWFLGMTHKDTGNLTEAIRYLLEAQYIYEQKRFDEFVAVIHYTIAQIYNKASSHEKAKERCFLALKIFEDLSLMAEQAMVHYELSRILRQLKEFNNAKFHVKRCLQILDNNIKPGLISKSFNQLGIIFYQTKNYDSALYNYEIARQRAKGLKSYNKKHAIALNNIGEVFMARNQFTKADSVFNIALKIKREIGDNEFTAGTLINLGKLELLKNDMDQATVFLEEIVYNLDISTISQHFEEAANLLLDVYKAGSYNPNHLKKLIELNKLFIEQGKILKNKKTVDYIHTVTMEYQLKREIDYHYQNSLKAKNKTLNITVITSLLIVGLLGLLYYREKRFKRFVKSLWQDLKDS